MTEPLRLDGLGDFLQKTVAMYRRHLRLFAGILMVPSLLAVGPALWLERAVSRLAAATELTDPGERLAQMSPYYAGIALYVVVFSLIQCASLGAIAAAVSDVRQGRPTAIGAAWRRVARHHIGIATIGSAYPVAFFTGALVSAIAFIVPATLLAIVLKQFLAMVLLLPILAFGLIGTMLLLARCAVAVPALMSEATGGFAAFRRSASMTQESTLFLVIVLLIGLLAGNVVLFMFEGPFLVGRWLAGEGDLEMLLHATQVVAGTIGRAFAMPIPMLVLCLLYHELKDREQIISIGSAPPEGSVV